MVERVKYFDRPYPRSIWKVTWKGSRPASKAVCTRRAYEDRDPHLPLANPFHTPILRERFEIAYFCSRISWLGAGQDRKGFHMARRFQKVNPLDALIASDGDESPEKELIVYGSKWVDFVATGQLVEIAADSSEEPAPTSNRLPLRVEQFTPAAATTITGDSIGTGGSSIKHFAHTLSVAATIVVKPTTLVVKVDGSSVATDDGLGVVSGTGVTGTINYTTGALVVDFATAPGGGLALVADYSRNSVITTAYPFVATDSSGLVVFKVTTLMVHGTGGSKYVVSDSNKLLLGTAANGSDLYTVVYTQ